MSSHGTSLSVLLSDLHHGDLSAATPPLIHPTDSFSLSLSFFLFMSSSWNDWSFQGGVSNFRIKYPRDHSPLNPWKISTDLLSYWVERLLTNIYDDISDRKLLTKVYFIQRNLLICERDSRMGQWLCSNFIYGKVYLNLCCSNTCWLYFFLNHVLDFFSISFFKLEFFSLNMDFFLQKKDFWL